MNAQTRDVKISLTTHYLHLKPSSNFFFWRGTIFNVVTRYFNIMHETFTKNMIIHIRLITSKLSF